MDINKLIYNLAASGLTMAVTTTLEPRWVECPRCHNIVSWAYCHDGDEFGLEGFFCDDCIMEIEYVEYREDINDLM